MTDTTKEIFEKYQVRKTKTQKTAFIDYAMATARENGYPVRIEKGRFGARNIVVGELEGAKVVYTAHYDTCARLPFPNFITPKNISFYILYQLLIVIAAFTVAFAIGFMFGMLSATFDWNFDLTRLLSLAAYLVLISLVFSGAPNKHTANDNTSGVTVLFDIMAALPDESRGSVAFVFFDLEEAGLFGSSSFASKNKRVMKNKLLINFDCVSDGENILFALRKNARNYKDVIEKAFEANENVTVEVADKGIFYPSDQMCFPCGVGAAALKKTKSGKTLYMDRIHTSRDTVYREENIAFLKDGAVRLVELL